MSNYVIDNINDAAAKRIARTYQVEALARNNATPEVNRYQPTRAEWVHAFFPGLDSRLGKLTPQQAALDDAINRLDPAHQAEARARLGLPPLDDGTKGPTVAGQRLRRPQPRKPPPLQPPTSPDDGLTYTILDTGGVWSVILPFFLASGSSGQTAARTDTLNKPVRVRGIEWHNDQGANNDVGCSITVPQIGFAYSHQVSPQGSSQLTGHSLACDFLALDGLTAQLQLWVGPDISGQEISGDLHITIAYNDVRTKRKIAATPVPYEEVQVSPWIGLDDNVARAFDLAGIPDEWYVYRPGEATPQP